MKRFTVALIAGLTVGVSATAQNRIDRITVPLSEPSRPVTLNINLYAGVVDIRAFDGNEIIIEATAAIESPGSASGRGRLSSEKNQNNVVKRPAAPQRERAARARGQGAADAAGLTRLPQPTPLDIEEANNVVSLRGPAGQRVDLTIQVPVRTSLRLKKSATGPPSSPGTVTVRGLDGDLEIHTEAGAITLSDVAGSVVAHSTSGSVIATVRRVTPDRPMAFTSYSGNVDVTLPRSVKADLILLSDRRDVFTDFELETRSNPAGVSKLPGGGFLRKGGAPIRATANGGGPEFELQSYSGNVYLRRGN